MEESCQTHEKRNWTQEKSSKLTLGAIARFSPRYNRIIYSDTELAIRLPIAYLAIGLPRTYLTRVLIRTNGRIREYPSLVCTKEEIHLVETTSLSGII